MKTSDLLSEYDVDYYLPESSIAPPAAEPRDSSRLLVLNQTRKTAIGY